MTEEVKKKGMSKGCLVGLIIVGVLVVMIIVASVTCYMKRDDLAKFAATTVVNGAKQMLVENPVEGVDTEKFNKLIDAFIEKLNSSELDSEKYAMFFQKIQTIPSDKIIDSDEIILLQEAIVEYFPELSDLSNITSTVDSTVVEDTMLTE